MSHNALVTEVSDFQRQDTSTDGLLYTLDFDCPFPWPVNPSYTIGTMMSARTGNNDATSSDDNSRNQISLGEQQVDDEGDAPAASTSKVLLENMDAQDDHAPLQAGEGSRAMAIEEAVHEVNGNQYPETLQEYYWECLYSAASSSKTRNDPAARFLLAFKTDRYKTTTLHEDGSHVVHQAYRDVLASILHTKLGKLDKKYHSDLPAIINEWTRHHELMNVEPVEKEEDNNEAGVDEASLAEQAEHARASMSIVELDYLKQAWSSWIRSAEESQTEHAPSAKDRSSRIKSMVRERLGALETAELQLQILVALELLSVLPIPSYLTARSAHHRRAHSSHSHNWLTILRNGTPQRSTTAANGARKRKKDLTSNYLPHGPVTSSNLTTPRQPGLFDVSAISHFDAIAEDQEQQDDEAYLERQKLERLFKDTARLLDAQTDNLAIQQTVANAIGGLSLADLMGETTASAQTGSEDGKGKGKEEELDQFQSFWLEVVEEHYSTRLPSDILSGCHSKFFSNALDPSLVSTSQLSNGSHPHPSPFHHPTPDLRQLARSVHLANAQAERNAIPQSPTLAKLLAAKADTNRIDEENADDLGENDDVGWLMPAPAPAALAANKAKGAVQQLSLKNVLKRTSSSNSAFSTANLHHHTRIVEFGKVKEVKEKRDEINARKMKQSNGLKPFSSSLALVNAHAASAAQTAGSTNGGSAMANSIGARNMVTSMPTASKNEEARLSTTTLSQISGRISKRKAASPKKMVQPEKGSKGRTLVLATPVKLKSKTSSSQSLWNSRPPMIQGNGNGNLQERARLGKSKSLPAFVWGNPAAGRGIDEVDEEDLDRGFGLGDEEQDMEGDREEDQISRHTHVLAGETPRK